MQRVSHLCTHQVTQPLQPACCQRQCFFSHVPFVTVAFLGSRPAAGMFELNNLSVFVANPLQRWLLHLDSLPQEEQAAAFEVAGGAMYKRQLAAVMPCMGCGSCPVSVLCFRPDW